MSKNPPPDLIVENIGLDPTGPWFSFFQFWKTLPLLVGNQYNVHLKITNRSGKLLQNVRILLRMWVKERGVHEQKPEVPADIAELSSNQSRYVVYSEPYLMRDTGASDLEIQAYADGLPLTLRAKRRKKNLPTQIFVYAYHVEPWRSSVLGILISSLISTAGVLLALWIWLPWLLPWSLAFLIVLVSVMVMIWRSKSGKPCQSPAASTGTENEA